MSQNCNSNSVGHLWLSYFPLMILQKQQDYLHFFVKMRCEMGADDAFINLYNDYLACTMGQRL